WPGHLVVCPPAEPGQVPLGRVLAGSSTAADGGATLGAGAGAALATPGRGRRDLGALTTHQTLSPSPESRIAPGGEPCHTIRHETESRSQRALRRSAPCPGPDAARPRGASGPGAAVPQDPEPRAHPRARDPQAPQVCPAQRTAGRRPGPAAG